MKVGHQNSIFASLFAQIAYVTKLPIVVPILVIMVRVWNLILELSIPIKIFLFNFKDYDYILQQSGIILIK